MKYALINHHYINADDATLKLHYKCPFCHRRLVLHRRKANHRSFFVHADTSKNYYNPAETSEHLMGKQQLFRFFKTYFNDVTVEKYLNHINQWPDLMVDNRVIEFQCSPISIKRLTQRIAGYSKMNLKSWWLLGSPYYKRHLRPDYLARFINYSTRLGFFILFWKTSNKYLEIHYRLREQGGYLRYQIKRIRTCRELLYFISKNRLKPYLVNHGIIIKGIHSEISLNQRRLFHGNRELLELQSEVNPRHNSLMGCPLVCHYPVITFPIFRDQALLWRIWIMILIDQGLNIPIIYERANKKLRLPLVFCQMRNYSKFYKKAFWQYIKLLYFNHYIDIDFDTKKITWLKKPRWFSSYYDKTRYLRSGFN